MDKSEAKKATLKDKLSSVYRDYMGEYKKIVWPNREYLVKQTVSVIVTSAVVGVIIAGLDSIFNIGQNLFTALVK